MVRIGDEFKPGQDVPNQASIRLYMTPNMPKNTRLLAFIAKGSAMQSLRERRKIVLVIAVRHVELDKHFKKA